jgi:hypothetical protein
LSETELFVLIEFQCQKRALNRLVLERKPSIWTGGASAAALAEGLAAGGIDCGGFIYTFFLKKTNFSGKISCGYKGVRNAL